MIFPTIEASRDMVTVTGSTVDQVFDGINRVFAGLTTAYISFTTPVKQADGNFVALGHVRLTDQEFSI